MIVFTNEGEREREGKEGEAPAVHDGHVDLDGDFHEGHGVAVVVQGPLSEKVRPAEVRDELGLVHRELVRLAGGSLELPAADREHGGRVPGDVEGPEELHGELGGLRVDHLRRHR